MKRVVFAPVVRENDNLISYDLEVFETLNTFEDITIYYFYNNDFNQNIINYLKKFSKMYNLEFINIDSYLNDPLKLFPISQFLITDYSAISILYSLHTSNYTIFYLPQLNQDFYSFFKSKKMLVNLEDISFFADNKNMLKLIMERLFEYGNIESYIKKFIKESIFV